MPRSSKQFIDGNTGFMSPRMFEETVELLFRTKREFTEFTGISSAQVQRYCSGASAVPKSVALLVLALGMLRRNGIALPDLAELGAVVDINDYGDPENLGPNALAEIELSRMVAKRARPGRKPKVKE